MADNNRRRFARVKPKQLTTRIHADSGLHIGLAVENISLGGLFVRSGTPLKVGTAVTLDLLRPGAALPLTITGKITSMVSPATAKAHNLSPGMGIAFDPLPDHVVPRLDGLIATIDPSGLEEPPEPKAKSPREMEKQIEALKLEVLKRNRTITDLTAEIDKLHATLRRLTA